MAGDAQADDMVPLEGVRVIMAADPKQVIKRFHKVNKRGYPRVEHMAEMREGCPIAIVGGGPSLAETWPELKRFRKIMVCGSAHDYVVSLGIRPTWTVVCDPDPVMARYISRPSPGTKFLVASACAEEVFDLVSNRDFAVWNCGDELIASEKWEKQGLVFGGGCTVLTRAIWIAGAFGFWNQHFFGCDTSIREDGKHHAYDFLTDEEELGDVTPLQFRKDGPRFLVPNYLVGQAFDLQTMIAQNAHRLKVTVHGSGLFAEMMAEADRRRKHAEKKRSNGSGDAPVPRAADGE